LILKSNDILLIAFVANFKYIGESRSAHPLKREVGSCALRVP
jgi:hypothetical protein